MKHWWCMGCETEVRLGKHGQCEVCGSEAVDLTDSKDSISGSSSARKSDSGPAPRYAGA
jgi:Zn finger protein HypA/HybF involved in hydrogenase expression